MMELMFIAERRLVAVALVLLVCGAFQARLAVAEMDNTPLCNAVKSRSLQRVQDNLSKMKPDVTRACTIANAQYPLDVAAENGFVEICQLLIEAGADVNQSGILGYTPLLHAADNLYPDIVKLLLENKADINAKLLPIQGVKIVDSGGRTTGTEVDVGMNIMTVATASYLRKYPFASAREQAALTTAFCKIIDLLFEYCSNFVDDAAAAQTRLASEGHMDECNYISGKANRYQPGC